MNDSENKPLNTDEVCEATQISTKLITKIVAHGIIEQTAIEPDSWVFNSEMVLTIHKAVRLRRDLNLNWSGVALAIDLIGEIENLRQENTKLQHRLRRYIDEV